MNLRIDSFCKSVSILILLLLLGCACPQKQSSETSAETTARTKSIRDEENKVIDLIKGIHLVERRRQRDMDLVVEPLSEMDVSKGKLVRETMCSDSVYLERLRSISKTLENRLNAVQAEQKYYESMMMRDGPGLVAPLDDHP